MAEHDRDTAAAQRPAPVYQRFASMTPAQLAADNEARHWRAPVHQQLRQCHGADAKGSKGFPT